MKREINSNEEIDRVLAGFAKHRSSGDPFNSVIDQLTDYIKTNPKLFKNKDPLSHMSNYVACFAEKIRLVVVERLKKPHLNNSSVLRVEVERDWIVNAAVEKQPPYRVYISTNLFMFCAKLSELFLSGLGLSITDESSQHVEAEIPPHISVDDVGRNVFAVLREFVRDQSITTTDLPLSPSHYTMHQIVFFSIMTFIVCHEFGHVIINEYSNDGTPPPFSDIAENYLEANFQKLIHSGMHDQDDRLGLRRLKENELQQVFRNWVTEINADILGASLASEYMKFSGPWKGGPQIVGYTYLSIHLCFMAQQFLYSYKYCIDPNFLPISKGHPPMDYRMHCILSWMYKENAEEVSKGVTQYCQEVLAKAFGMAGFS
ncbi:MAG: hypothetical protein ACYTFW_04530 [Planctomycetota bacterium]